MQLAVRPKAHRCTMERIILALGILGLVTPALPMEPEILMGGREDGLRGGVHGKGGMELSKGQKLTLLRTARHA